MPDAGDSLNRSRRMVPAGERRAAKHTTEPQPPLPHTRRLADSAGRSVSVPSDAWGSSRRSSRRTHNGDRVDLWQALFGRRANRKAREEVALQRLSQPSKPPAGSTSRRPREVLQSMSSSGFPSEPSKRLTSLGRTRGSLLPQGSVSSRNNTQLQMGNVTRLPIRGDTLGQSSQLGGLHRLAAPADRFKSRRDRANRPLTVLQSSNTVLQSGSAAATPNTRIASRREVRSRQRQLEMLNDRTPTLLETPHPGAAKNRPSGMGRQRSVGSPRRASRGVTAAVYATRMLILSIGVGVLAGTMLSVWDPASRAPAGASQQTSKHEADVSKASPPAIAPAQANFSLGQEITPLKAPVQTLVTQAAQNPQMAPGVFLLDLDTNAYLDVNGEAAVPAASTIKIPILIAFFQDVDAGKIRLDEVLTMRKELIATGSGDLQFQPPGSQFSALETVTKMITISDNTATNMLIARLGGIVALKQRFKSWGLTATSLNHLLPDLEGTNMTSPKEMALLMARISQGDLVSMRSRDRMLEIMRQTANNSLLPRGLGEGALIAHKTGDIGSMVGDIGLIDLPNGKRYIAAVLVKRSFNDDRAQELIRQISQVTYQHFSRSLEAQNVPVESAPVESNSAGEVPSDSSVPRADTEMPRNLDGTPIDPASTAQVQPR